MFLIKKFVLYRLNKKSHLTFVRRDYLVGNSKF